MPLPRPLPSELSGRPFSAAEALALGVTRDQLRGRRVERVAHGWYVLAGPGEELMLRCSDLAGLLPPDAAFSHHTAAQLYGLPVPASERLHVSLTPRKVLPQHAAVQAHGQLLPDAEVQPLGGLRVVTPERLFLDLALVLPRTDLIVLGDAMLNRQLTDVASMGELLLRYPGRKGAARAAAALPLLEPLAASPMETRTRLIYVDAGLPRPKAQVVIADRWGRFVARSDLGWEEVKVCSEYEGRQHAIGEQFATDVERYTALVALGWVPLRYAARHVYRNPGLLVAQARQVLRARGLAC